MENWREKGTNAKKFKEITGQIIQEKSESVFVEPTPPEKEVFKKACIVCRGDVTEKISEKFNPMTGPMIIGPGSRSQFYFAREGLYCQKCGLKYEFLPGERHKESEES